MDELRARAYLDILLNRDSRLAAQDGRPGQDGVDGPDGADGAGGADRPGWPEPAIPGDPHGSVIPAGFAGTINLTVTATTLLGLAGRPGEIGGIGPVDPNPEQIHRIVTEPEHQPTPVSSTSTCRTVVITTISDRRRRTLRSGASARNQADYVWLGVSFPPARPSHTRQCFEPGGRDGGPHRRVHWRVYV
jgi:hypothetical protein